MRIAPATRALDIGENVTRGSPRGRSGPKRSGSSFFRNTSVMIIGTMLGQAASVALAPVLTRVFTAEDFGYLSVYSAVLALLGVTAALGLDLAIPLAASEFELANLIAGSSLAVVITSSCVGLILVLMPAQDLAWLGLESLDSHSYLVPIGLACLGGYYVMVAAATAVGRFTDIARTKITQGLGGPLTQIALGLAGAGGPGLVIGYILGQSSGVLLLFSRVVLSSRSLRAAISWRGMRVVVHRYIRFPLFASWTRMIDLASSGAILYVLFATWYSSEIAGFMFLAERVVARPLLIVSSSILQVFAGEAGNTARQDPDALRRRFWQVVQGQFLFALVWILLVNLLAAWAVPLLFGPAWAGATPFLHALSPMFVALTVLHPVSNTLQMLDRQGLAAIWTGLRFALLVLAATISWHMGLSAESALWVCSAVQTAMSVGMLATMASCIRAPHAAAEDGTDETNPAKVA